MPISLVLLFVQQADHKRRLAELQRQVLELQQGRMVAPLPTAEPTAAPMAAEPATAADPRLAWTSKDRQKLAMAPAPAPAPATYGPTQERPTPPHAPSRAQLAFDAGLAWARENWFYAIAAVSLGLSGIFLVQYGIEKGLLPPTARVLAALAFGAVLVTSGELARRRWGDDEDSPAAFLPSTFSGAGIVVLYAAVLAARTLYGLIGPEVALGGLVLVSCLCVTLGWLYGPLLAAVGLAGAAAAPFLVGGESESGTPFYLYYALLATAGLLIQAKRQWGWVAYFAVGLSYALGVVVDIRGGDHVGFVLLMAWLALACIAFPRLELWPTHQGPSVFDWCTNTWATRVTASAGQGASLEEPAHRIPTTAALLASGATVMSSALLFLAARNEPSEGQTLSLAIAAFLTATLTIWTRHAPALRELAVVPAGTFLLFVLVMDQPITSWRFVGLPAETVIVALALIVSIAALWRSLTDEDPLYWGAGAAFFAPATTLLVQLAWEPAATLGKPAWAAHVFVSTGLMVAIALTYARADAEPRRTAWATLSALSLMTLAAFTLLSGTALTIAVAVMVATAAWLDRRFDLREMSWFIFAGGLLLSWRLIIDPGLDAYLHHLSVLEVLAAFGAALGGLAVVRAVLPKLADRDYARRMAEAGIWAYGGVLACVLLFRLLERIGWDDPASSWSLYALTGSAVALAQLYQLRRGARVPAISWALMLAAGVPAIVGFAATLTAYNPFIGWNPAPSGPLVLDSLSIAYALPGAAFVGLAAVATWLPGKSVFRWIGTAFLGTYVFLEIRRFFHDGLVSESRGFTQPELYLYTVVLLVLGGTLLYRSIEKASPELRRVAIAVIGIAVAKVFLVDAQGLTGLLRVFSFLALGLVLAGLAWLNRWAAMRARDAAQVEATVGGGV